MVTFANLNQREEFVQFCRRWATRRAVHFENSADDEPRSMQCVSKILQTMSHEALNVFRRFCRRWVTKYGMCFEDPADDEPQSAQCVSKILQTMSHKVRNVFRRFCRRWATKCAMCFEDSADDEPQSAQCVSKILQTMSHKVRNAFRRCIGCIQCCHEDSQSHLLSIYLENRKQSCRIGGTSSDMKEIICGIPQGSCLGPLLFLIYINDLPLSLQKSHFSMYADDTAILLSSESIDDLPNDLNLDLLKLQDWLDANKLSLNFVKTQSLIIDRFWL